MTRHIVLVGGGHCHVQVMRLLAAHPTPDAAITLVTDRVETPYSGMLPGHIAGTYTRDEMHIDLARLAGRTGARLVLGAACSVDPAAKRVLLADGATVPYDLVSLNVGIAPDLRSIAGAEECGIAVKPISGFLDQMDTVLAAARVPGGPRRFAVVGGGAAGVELAHALRLRLDRDAPGWGVAPADFEITLLSAGDLVPALNDGVRRRVRRSLHLAGITVRTGFRVLSIDARGATSDQGERVVSDVVLFATAARAPGWLRTTGLPLDTDGSILTEDTLQVRGFPDIFAVGDCARVINAPRPKAGVFAVRQGPVLARNLRAALSGAALTPHRPQNDYLTLLISGDRRAIAGRGRWLSVEGPLIWHLKDWIDRRFVAQFASAPRET